MATKGQIDRKAMKLYKLNLRFAHDKFSQVEMDLVFGLAAQPPGAAVHWLPVMAILLKRLFDAGYIHGAHSPNVQAYTNGMRTDPLFISLTPRGHAFVAELGVTEL